MLNDADRAMLEARNFAHLATVMADGSPQVSVVWVDLDGDTILINSAEGRTKTRNVRRDPRVALSVYDQQNPYSELMVRGRVVELTHDGAKEHIDSLAKKYLGKDIYPWHQPDQQRVILRIEIESVARRA
jgi:PPOX class probable F420-dependent enzyme